jgi:hypothetical protein
MECYLRKRIEVAWHHSPERGIATLRKAELTFPAAGDINRKSGGHYEL